MDNGDLIVDDLVQELAVSRSVFFKKLKTLTGLAPIEFIKEMRVKRAAQLIESGDYNMTQIAYMVGINDPRYFSKCFKQRFGMTPTEYKENAKISDNFCCYLLVLAAFIFNDFLRVCLSVGYFFCYVSELLMLFYYFSNM